MTCRMTRVNGPISPRTPAYGSILARHREQLPKSSRPAVPGSAQRILLFDPVTGAVNWEGMPVGTKDPIPELEDDTGSR